MLCLLNKKNRGCKKLVSKFGNIIAINDINLKNYKRLLDDEEMAKAIFETSNFDITKNYQKEDWKKVCKMAIEKDSLPLKLAIIKSENVPPMFISELMHYLNHDERFYAFLAKNISLDLFFNTKDYYSLSELHNFLYEYGEKFSSKAITLLCQTMSEEEQAKLDFMPFYYIKSDCKVIEELETFLNNKNNAFFKRGIPEKFTTTIASNNEIPNHIRNKAFEIGYNLAELHTMTPEMVDTVYRSCTEAIFMPDDGSDKMKEMKKALHSELSSMVCCDFLTEGQQLDYIEQSASTKTLDNTTYDTIIRNTKFPDVLKVAIYHLERDLLDKMADNDKAVTCDVIKEALHAYESKHLSTLYTSAVFRSATDHYLLSPFMQQNDISIFRAVMTSCQTPNAVANSIVDHTKHMKYNEELSFLRDFRERIIDSIPSPNREKIMKFTTSIFINQDIDFRGKGIYSPKLTPFYVLLRELDSNCKEQWFPFTKEESNLLKLILKNLGQKYPRFKNNICKPILRQLETVEKDSQIVQEYPNIFVINNEDVFAKHLERMPFTHINFDEIYNMSDKDMQRFIQVVSECDNPSIPDLLFSQIFRETNLMTIDDDILYQRLYKSVDLFNKLDEILHPVKTIKWDISDYDEEIEF